MGADFCSYEQKSYEQFIGTVFMGTDSGLKIYVFEYS